MEDRVSNEHPKYCELQPKREAYLAVKGGTDALQKGGVKYLPKYPAEEKGDYDARLKASTSDGIVCGGVDTLCGAVFEGEVDVSKVNGAITPLLENIDNRGNHFNVFVREAFESAFDGSAVILVDFPQDTDETKQLKKERGAEADKILNTRPYWILYKADDVTNWRYKLNTITNKEELEMLTVKVISSEPVGQFGSKDVTRYRVWMLEGQTVKWETWVEKEGGDARQKEFMRESNGTMQNMTSIPAAIIGKLTDEPRLLVESRLEIKAYQKESSFDIIEYLSIPVLYTKGYDEAEPLALGAAAHVKLPADVAAEVGYVQIDSVGHDSLKGTIREVKDYIKARLNYIVSQASPQSGGDKTATEVVTEDKDKQARLVVWAEQLKDAVELALGFTAEFMGKGRDQGGEIVFNTKWMVAEQKAQEANAMKLQQQEADVKKTLAGAAGSNA